MRVLLAALVAGLTLCAGARAGELPDALIKCVDEARDRARLRCYDRAMEQLIEPRTQPAAAAEPAPEPPPTPAAEDEFGMNPDLARGRDQKPKAKPELHAVVAQLSASGGGTLLVVLDNGQVWRQKYAERIQIREGDEVVITQGWSGGYRLSGPHSRKTVQVRRVR